MEREGAAVMIAVLESLVEADPFHSSRTMASLSGLNLDDGESKSPLLSESAMEDEFLQADSRCRGLQPNGQRSGLLLAHQ